MTKRRVLLVLLAVNAVLWGHRGFADPPAEAPADIAGLEAAAREGCKMKGLTLRALALVYDEQSELVGARVFCGPPTRQDV